MADFYKLHLYSQSEETVYEYVFVRVVFARYVVSASDRPGGSGAAATTRISVSGRICNADAIANS